MKMKKTLLAVLAVMIASAPVFIFFLLTVVIGLSSCATHTQATYAQIEGKLTAQQTRRSLNYVEVKSALHQQKVDELYDSLNFKRLEGQAVITDSSKGGVPVYVGQIINLSKWSRIQVNIYALDENGTMKYPAIVSSFVAPGQTIEKALLPGRYFFTLHIKGRLEDQRTFSVSVQLYDVMGKDTHWYIIWDAMY